MCITTNCVLVCTCTSGSGLVKLTSPTMQCYGALLVFSTVWAVACAFGFGYWTRNSKHAALHEATAQQLCMRQLRTPFAALHEATAPQLCMRQLRTCAMTVVSGQGRILAARTCTWAASSSAAAVGRGGSLRRRCRSAGHTMILVLVECSWTHDSLTHNGHI